MVPFFFFSLCVLLSLSLPTTQSCYNIFGVIKRIPNKNYVRQNLFRHIYHYQCCEWVLAFIGDKGEHEWECFHFGMLCLMLRETGSLELLLMKRYQQSVFFLVYIQILRHASLYLAFLSFSLAYRRHFYLNIVRTSHRRTSTWYFHSPSIHSPPQQNFPSA